ncbi:TetR/AcrR family transcriptional regulator [uncultured Odoribacter sp.]|uniref:TetR/AcrR family transcriptional regulator n=1 Tax=uncultured Odoribacter sp. TaxID=876416 RepID=UPI00261E24FC|nr:TetR/AcrR family transcriptional regulator [uncultured Odoribacter sp.]
MNYSKEELLANISDLFLTYGLRSTSMDDICNYLKISKKTLYHIFENKDDVVEQVMWYRLEYIRKKTTPAEVSKIGPVLFLYDMKKHILENLNSRIPANYFDLKKYHPEVDKKIRAEKDKIMKSILKGVLSVGVKEGFFRGEADLELQIFLLNRSLSFLEELERPLEADYPVPLLISTIVDNFILSMSTEQGRKEFEKIKKEEKI